MLSESPSLEKWFRSRPSDDLPNIVCLPYAGGDGYSFRTLQEKTRGQALIHPVYPPGHASRLKEPLPTSIEEYVSNLALALRPFAQKPYVLLGSSMGAWVGYELCSKMLQMSEILPAALIICAAASPFDKMESFRFADLNVDELLKELARINPEFDRAIKHPDLIEFMMPIIQSDLNLCGAWSPDIDYWQQLSIPIYGFYGTTDSFVSKDEMLRWGRLTNQHFSLEGIHGNHFFIDNPPDGFILQLVNICRTTLLTGMSSGRQI